MKEEEYLVTWVEVEPSDFFSYRDQYQEDHASLATAEARAKQLNKIRYVDSVAVWRRVS